MAACVNFRDCAFFNGKMARLPMVSDILQEQLCMGDSKRCARYVVKAAGLPVPDDLYPDDYQRATDLLSGATTF